MRLVFVTFMVAVAQAHAAPMDINNTELSTTPAIEASAKVDEQMPKERPVEPKQEVKQDKPVEVVAPAPPAPEPQPVQHPVGCENYQHLINQYNWNKTVMTAICQAESSGNPSAVGDTRVIGGIYAPSCGLFQIRTLQGRPSCEALKDPATNVAWAYRIYLGQGYNAWSVCRSKVSCY